MFFFGPQLLETADSKYSGQIKVIKSSGQIYLSTGHLTQSGGLVKDVWQPVLKHLTTSYRLQATSCLILGLAGGTLAGMLAKKFPGIRITGVEIDPVMISLGKKYLNLDQIPNLKIVIADANSYILNHKSYFDSIFVDLYIGDQLPVFVYSLRFLNRLKKLSSCVIINHLFFDEIKRQKARELIQKLETLFPSVKLIRKLTNLLIICS